LIRRRRPVSFGGRQSVFAFVITGRHGSITSFKNHRRKLFPIATPLAAAALFT
jgi:hypothetical protein